MMKVWEQRLISKFPPYNTAVEDKNHISVCQEEGAILEWENYMSSLKEWLDTHESCPDLAKLILNVVASWKQKVRITIGCAKIQK